MVSAPPPPKMRICRGITPLVSMFSMWSLPARPQILISRTCGKFEGVDDPLTFTSTFDASPLLSEMKMRSSLAVPAIFSSSPLRMADKKPAAFECFDRGNHGFSPVIGHFASRSAIRRNYNNQRGGFICYNGQLRFS